MNTTLTIDDLLKSEAPEARFAAVRVTNILARRAQATVSPEDMAVLAQLPADRGHQALPEKEAVALSYAAIRIAATDPNLAPWLKDAIAEQAASKKQLGVGVLEAGVILTLAMFVAKCRIERDANGRWTFVHEPISDKALTEVAKAVQEIAKAANKTLALIPGKN